MRIKVDMHSGNIQEFSSVDLIRGQQGMIFDDSGISFRIRKNSENEYFLSDANTDYTDGFFSSFCKEFYDVKTLRSEIIRVINELGAISGYDVEDFRTSGIIRWLARKEPRLNQVPGFAILSEMEVFERIINMSTGIEATDPFEVMKGFEDDVQTDIERMALKTIRYIYTLRNERNIKQKSIATPSLDTKVSLRLTGAEQIVAFVQERKLTFNDVLLAAVMFSTKQRDMLSAQEQMLQTQMAQDRGIDPNHNNDEYQI